MTREKAKAWVGIDPGKDGAMAIIDEYGGCLVEDFDGVNAAHCTLLFWGAVYDIQVVMLEKVWGVNGNSARSNTSFMKHVGEWLAIIKLCGLPYDQVLPQTWMKRRVPRKLNKKDKPSIAYVQRKYPGVPLRGPRGGYKDGRSDAICIAEYARERGTK